HLCNEHIGFESTTDNLFLTCKWKDCGAACAKQDHITSHLRVHALLVCQICQEFFILPQDLKNHETLH
ncbi:hypothetical protein DFH09DRAFT_846156, partial [Mycena vulgaris]